MVAPGRVLAVEAGCFGWWDELTDDEKKAADTASSAKATGMTAAPRLVW